MQQNRHTPVQTMRCKFSIQSSDGLQIRRATFGVRRIVLKLQEKVTPTDYSVLRTQRVSDNRCSPNSSAPTPHLQTAGRFEGKEVGRVQTSVSPLVPLVSFPWFSARSSSKLCFPVLFIPPTVTAHSILVVEKVTGKYDVAVSTGHALSNPQTSHARNTKSQAATRTCLCVVQSTGRVHYICVYILNMYGLFVFECIFF